MRRLTILLATAAALLLVPAAQAFANGTLTINIEGSGGGEVNSYTEFHGIGITTPLLACSYNSPGPATGTCAAEMEYLEEEEEAGIVSPTAAPGSAFLGFVVEEGEVAACGTQKEGVYPGSKFNGALICDGSVEHNENVKLTAFFCLEGQSLEECLAGPTGPTNRRTLTVTKSAGGTEGIGTVSSKPKGVNCATACDKAVASMYEGQTVVLKGKAATGSTLSSWTGCESTTVISSTEGTCTVEMKEAKEVEAHFAGASKAITNPQPLTLSKGEGSGAGTVKGTGLACEAECTETTVLYQGPITGSKPKPGKVVILKETPAYGSEFSGWSGCTVLSASECEVKMEEAQGATAEFSAKPRFALTIEKNSYETGTGTVSSKPKGINCATACANQVMSVPSGETIVLKGKAATGMTLTGWTGCESTTVISATEGTCTVKPTAAATVKATFSGSPKAIVNPQALTLAKAGSGYGTVKAAGLACENECTSTQVLFQGPITGSKPKPGKTVVLKATSAPGSKPVQWTGCTPISASECEVAMEEAESVTATFDELE